MAIQCSCGFQHKEDGNHKHNQAPETPSLRFEEVCYRYPGGKMIIDNASFSLMRPAHVCVVGPNGGGKTTLLKLALGLLQPESGKIEVFGAPSHQACSHVGYVPQHTHLKTGFPITVREVVLTGCIERHRFGWHSKDCIAAADRIMEELGILDLFEHSFDQLSGGQRQRILIARALAGHPSLLLLDEPTANVDPGVEREVRDILVRLAKRMTVVTVSHDLDYLKGDLDLVLFVNEKVRALLPEQVNQDALWALYSRDGGKL